jgi:hypothetical protein
MTVIADAGTPGGDCLLEDIEKHGVTRKSGRSDKRRMARCVLTTERLCR